MQHAARNYAIVTAAYWGFTLTDGALRMLVLLHFYRLGSPFTLAFLFLLYEAAGVVANLIGGWLATRYGITRMLAVGLVTQIAGFTLLSMLQPGWTALMSVAWVVAAQGVCGVAKDLTKTASKSAIKVTAAAAKEESAGQLFRWVAWFTGSKNAMKGVGFFLGGLLLETLGFSQSLWAMAGLLALVLAGVLTSLPPLMGKGKASKSAKELFAKSPGINTLAAARVVLLGRGTCGSWSGCRCFCTPGAGPSRWSAAFWPCGRSATAWCRPGAAGGEAQRRRALHRGAGRPRVVGSAGAGAGRAGAGGGLRRAPARMGGGGRAGRVRRRLCGEFVGALLPDPGLCGVGEGGGGCGFYYAANALGRFIGTLLSGLLYQWGGLLYGLVGSAVMLAICWASRSPCPAAGRSGHGAGVKPPLSGCRAAGLRS
jgi:MFS family permease